MKLDESLPQTDGDRAPKENELHSTDWWAKRTPEELRNIIRRGFSGGPAFEGAVAEAERRARGETSRLREEAAIEAEPKGASPDGYGPRRCHHCPRDPGCCRRVANLTELRQALGRVGYPEMSLVMVLLTIAVVRNGDRWAFLGGKWVARENLLQLKAEEQLRSKPMFLAVLRLLFRTFADCSEDVRDFRPLVAKITDEHVWSSLGIAPDRAAPV